jgi:succinoglycan biosynthesis protein ExoM
LSVSQHARTASFPEPARNVRIGICIASYRRPELLAKLLNSLRDLDDTAGLYEIAGIIVVDNDADGSARQVVFNFQQTTSCPIIYDQVAERNIAIARNRGVEIALALPVDFVAFIDDDCTASPDWLTEMVQTSTAHGADIVWGRLRYSFESDVPEWVVRGELHSQQAQPTGVRSKTAESNNALVSAGVLASLPNPFDPDFGRSGGSDSLFFLRAHANGARIVWSNEGVVTETIQRSRATVGWFLQRAFRMGNSGVFVYRGLMPLHRVFAGRAMKGVGHMAIGVALLPRILVGGRPALVHSLRRCAFGVGIFSALLGYRYIEYRRVHGS